MEIKRKNLLVGFICTLILGPIGMFYISASAGLGWTLAGIALSVLTGGVLAPVVWLFSIIACLRYVQEHNRYVMRNRKALASIMASQVPAKAPMRYPVIRDPKAPVIK